MNIVSPRFAHIIVLFFTGLSTSGTEPGVTHNRRFASSSYLRHDDDVLSSTHPTFLSPVYLLPKEAARRNQTAS